ncbi:ATP-binding protein [Vibrio sp. NTOU-M3]|uniref:ATP-binding protein n=1 Tax=Vibrio sp. NTOU-M3 TaxID=3234954 RepID=UPI00349F8658
MAQTLTLIRGLPGSGKSTLAQTLDAQHFEADMYFVDEQGTYRFDANCLPQAHAWCLTMTEKALHQGQSVVVSNTFVRLWEMESYIHLSRQLGIKLKVVECTGSYPNVHGVPQCTIDKMRRRWQHWPASSNSKGMMRSQTIEQMI